MTAVQRPPPPLASSNGAAAFGSSEGVGDALDRFPAGLRVMVVDDDTTCLKILEQMLRKCEYNVTICSRATSALSLLRERKGHFDLVISDVHMPDMDGLKLLELIGLEMDLPVIMMSADSRTSMVMKGIKHGACDYLIKPVRFEELRNVWQHVVRKKWNDHKDHEQSGGVGESERQRQGADDVEHTLQSNDIADGSGTTTQKKKRDAKEDPDDGDLENDDASTSKKPRVVWSVELHQQFVNAVNQLGIDRAVPKRILELMNVRGLTRENVASHLQKYRLYLKRISGVAQLHGGLSNCFSGSMEVNARTVPFGRLDIQSLVASGQIPAQSLVAQHAGSLGRPSVGTGGLPSLDQPAIHASLQAPKCIPAECSPFGHHLTECQPGITRQTNIAVGDMPSEFGTWTSSHLIRMGNMNASGPANSENGNTSAQVLQQQQSNQSILGETNHANNTQLSCLVSASQSSTNFHTGNSAMPISQSTLLFPPPQASHNVPARNVLNLHLSFCNNSIVLGQNPTYSQPNCVQVDTERVVDDDLDAFLSGCSIPAPASSTVPSCSFPSDGSIGWKAVTSDFSSNPPTKLSSSAPLLGDMQNCSSQQLPLPDQGHGRNLGFVGKGTCIPSRFAVDDMKPQVDNQSQTNSGTLDEVSKVKTRDLPGFDGTVCSRQPALCHHTPK